MKSPMYKMATVGGGCRVRILGNIHSTVYEPNIVSRKYVGYRANVTMFGSSGCERVNLSVCYSFKNALNVFLFALSMCTHATM